ncbi:hypothetical protein QN375_06035 [Pseudomonas sp. MH9.2]|uniref:hypothetical protein n=1 Tax=unclassified Pseudomonas TaxID=196821 RepID=UPI002AC8F07A|nr:MULTISPECIES: hypothetical protein [unclassified Pseudomonas]MEB0009330.1 hypothetical protein [Pseudomonas sp. RTB2]MEB0018300.1 hypothetical protein [Pseudomonas sp. RTB3]MEB0025331.1 hypothetical protein [Pseudomonas sp. MH9.2]MEB0147179.1 hypothetical protein [Pseudomonas sp. CCC2.2]MEB0268521.1 hypothetical protein [Pseudomonas sp. 5B4]
MGYAPVLNAASFVAGFISAACWVVAAVVKVEPPEEMKGKPDGLYFGYIISSGADLIPTVKAQAKWNSAAAITAAVTVLLQIAANFLTVSSAQ